MSNEFTELALELAKAIAEDTPVEFHYDSNGPDYYMCKHCGGWSNIKYNDKAEHIFYEPINHDSNCAYTLAVRLLDME